MEETFNSVGFTGTQDGCTPLQMESLAKTLRGIRAHICWMDNGDCVGADEEAAAIWDVLGGNICLHPPKNRAKRAFIKAEKSKPPLEYLERNRRIVGDCVELVACPREMFEQQRSGTWATIRYARNLAGR